MQILFFTLHRYSRKQDCALLHSLSARTLDSYLRNNVNIRHLTLPISKYYNIITWLLICITYYIMIVDPAAVAHQHVITLSRYEKKPSPYSLTDQLLWVGISLVLANLFVVLMLVPL